MNADLEAIKDAATPDNPGTGEGMDLDEARTLADAYVAAHPNEFEQFQTMSLTDVVNAIDVLRSAGLEDDHWRAEAWHLHRYEPQHIGGVVEPTLRITGE